MRSLETLGTLIMALLLGIALATEPALADVTPPPNDEIANATAILSLPFTQELDTSGATPGADDPEFCGNTVGETSTVWYTFTPTVDTEITIDTAGTDYGTIVRANSDGGGGCDTNRITFNAQGGYPILIGIGSPYGVPGGHLVLSITGRDLLTAQVSIDPDGTTHPGGAATVSGTVKCNLPGSVEMFVILSQHWGHTFFAEVADQVNLEDCEGTVPWTLTLFSYHGTFRPGTATVYIYLHATDPDTGYGYQTEESAYITLKGVGAKAGSSDSGKSRRSPGSGPTSRAPRQQ